jgi:hypothetical protein
VQVLDLAGFELVRGEDAGVDLALRLGADFAVTDRDVALLDPPDPRERLELLTARLHWNGLARGRIDLDAGRMLVREPVGWLRLDGARATLRPWRGVALTGWGGVRVSGSGWLAPSTFTLDGVRESDRRRLRAGLLPRACGDATRCADPTLDDLAPAVGGRLAIAPPGAPLGGAIEARRTWRGGEVLEDRAAGELSARAGPATFGAAAEWDVFAGRLSVARAHARTPLGRALAASVELSHLHESWSADAIWNVFDTGPLREAELRVELDPPGAAARGYVAGGLQHQPASRFDGGGIAPFGAAGAALDVGRTTLSLDASGQGGLAGRQGWVTLGARRLLRSWLRGDARATAARVEDFASIDREAWFASASLLLAGRLERRAELSILLEDSTPAFRRNDVRLFAMLALGAEWDTRLR